MMLDIRGVADGSELRAHVTERMTAALSPLAGSATTARVTFTDVNGPKGGVDIRCGLTLRMPRWPEIHVEHMGETAWSAFGTALAVLERQLGRQLGRGRDGQRHPKKYFVARRLLAGAGPAGPSRSR